MNIAPLYVQWRQQWLNAMIRVDFVEQDNGIAKRGAIILKSGGIVEMEGSLSPIMLQAVMIINGLQEVRWNDEILKINLNNRTPDIRMVNIQDTLSQTSSTGWVAPRRPVPARTFNVRIGQQNLTDYSWYSTKDEMSKEIFKYGAIRLEDDPQDPDSVRVKEIIGPSDLCTSEYHCGVDILIAYLMAHEGALIRAKDRRSILFPGDAQIALLPQKKDERMQKVEVVEYLFSGRGY